MKKIYAFLLCLIMLNSFGQEGTIIPNFNYTGGSLQKIARASNGNILGLTHDNTVVRINALTGAITSFAIPHSATAIYGQSDGSILVGGNMNFSHTVNGITYRKILKYSSTGVFDPSFQCNITSYGEISVITEQPDTNPNPNNILVGSMTEVTQAQRLHRLSPNGTVDDSFLGFLPMDLINHGGIMAITTYSDGRILIGGNFTNYRGTVRNGIARLGVNGAVEPFNVTGFIGGVAAIAIQPDNKILIGGTFEHETTPATVKRYNLIRTDNAGVVETNFAPAFTNPLYVDYAYGINDIKIQSCGSKIIISGGIQKGIVRLNNTDGTDDATFNSGGAGFEMNGARQIILDPNDNIFTCGGPVYNATAVNQIVKLSGTSTLTAVPDAITLTIPAGSTTTSTLNVLANDKYNSIGATINNVDIHPALNPEIPGINFTYATGEITIAPNTTPGTYVYTYTICPKSGTAAACGCKTTTATITVIAGPPLIKLVANSDTFITACVDGAAGGFGGNITTNDTMDGGPIDFNKVTVSITNNGGMQNVSVSTNGVLSIPANTPSGIYTITYQICQKNAVNCASATVRICVNNGFNPGTGANNTIHAIALQPNGQIIIGGEFTEYDGKQRNRIARLNFDLSLDTSFDPNGDGFNGTVHALALVNNNILVGGSFTGTGGTIQKAKHLLARLDSNGNVDDTFTNNTFSQLSTNTEGAAVYSIVVHPLSDIYIGGSFDKIFGYTNKAKITKLNSNGAVASAFISPFVEGWGAAKNITLISTSIGSLNPGIYVGGRDLKLPGSLAEQTSVILCKINTSGTIDTNFALGKAPQSLPYEISSMAYTATTGFIVTGGFDNYNGASMRNIAKIDRTNGSAITSFNPGSSTGDFFERIHAVAIDNTTNKIIIGGIFTKFNTNPAKKIARLNSDGSFDASFNTGNGTPGTGLEHGILKIEGYGVNALKIQADGRIVVGGRFLTFNGMQAKYITRLSQDTPVIQGRKNMYTEENVSKGISIYPNPSEGVFNIDFRGYDENTFDITIYNALGQLIHKGLVTPQNTNQIDLTSFGAGSYFITLQNANETINKIVVKK